ncbi:MAG: DUF481 domain-containing protein [Chitinophagaceae bacterium]|nr:DUF481 domain-containing protein [Chitinophagaceae bacterium]
MNYSLKTAIVVVLLYSAFTSSAQIINIENARMQSDTTGWMGGAGAYFSLNQNKEKIVGGSIQAHLQHKTKSDKSLWLFLGDYGLLKAGDEKLIAEGFGHIRYNRKLNSWLRWEAFGQFQKNVITQIDSRYLIGTGPRFRIVKNKIFRLYAASLVMYEREKEVSSTVPAHTIARSSSYLSFTLTPVETTDITSTTFFQPAIGNFNDYRILNQLKVGVKATKHFSLSLKWNYLFDKLPAGDAPQTTYSLSTGIDYEF